MVEFECSFLFLEARKSLLRSEINRLHESVTQNNLLACRLCLQQQASSPNTSPTKFPCISNHLLNRTVFSPEPNGTDAQRCFWPGCNHSSCSPAELFS